MQDKTTDLVDSQDDEQGEGTPKKRGKLIMLPVLLLGLGGGGFVGMSTLSEPLGGILATRELNKPPDGGGGGGGHGAESPRGAQIHLVDNLVVNPARSGGSRFLLTTVAIEVPNPGLADVVDSHDVEIRAALILVLGAKTTEELTDIANRGVIASEIRRAIEEILGPGVVTNVFIPQFVIQ